MLQDLRNKKRTEIDYINGAVVYEGERMGLSQPINQALTHLIRFIEALN
jgi:2-dehydropantoate 2-reductase